MTIEEFGGLFASLDIPSRYGHFKNAKAVPYIVYMVIEKNAIYADGIVVYSEPWIELRLYTEARDWSAEAEIERMLTDAGIAYEINDREYDEKEGIHTMSYSFQLEEE